MNHSFVPSQSNPSICEGYFTLNVTTRVHHPCTRSAVDHGKTAQCEACTYVGPCEVINDLLLCPACFSSELLTPQSVPIIAEQSSTERVESIRDELIADDNPTALEGQAVTALGPSGIKKMEDFFNASTEPIIELQKRIMADESIGTEEDRYYRLASVLKTRYLELRDVLFPPLMEAQLKIATEQRAITYHLNTIAHKLRAEYREELHLSNIDYQPKPVAKKAAAVSGLNKLDKAILVYAEKLGITFEEAKRRMGIGLKAINECSCKETPGICKVHGVK